MGFGMGALFKAETVDSLPPTNSPIKRHVTVEVTHPSYFATDALYPASQLIAYSVGHTNRLASTWRPSILPQYLCRPYERTQFSI